MTIGLLRLYPPEWRERYGDEFAELLRARPPSLRDRIDIVRGAMDARIHPQVAADRPPRTAAARDRLLAIAAVTAGLLFSAWAAVIVVFSPRWDEMSSVDDALLGVSYGAGLLGAVVGIVVLLGLAFRHLGDMRAPGAIGAVLAAIGFFMFTGESGVPAVVLLFVGTVLMSAGLGRAVGWLASLAMLVATMFLAAAMFGFAGGHGQDLVWLWMLVVYGPSWILLGIKLRNGVHVAAQLPMTPPASAAA